MTRPRHPRSPLLVAALLAVALAATACANVTSPQGWAGAVAADGTVLASTDRGKLAALTADNLSPIWTFPSDQEADKNIDLEAIYGTPVVSGDTVYFGAYDGSVHALDLAAGRPKWGRPFLADGPIIAALVVEGDSVYAASDDGNLYVLDAQTGGEKDRFDAGDSVWARPLLADGTLYVAAVNGKLFALDAGTLKPRWDEPFEAEGGLLSDPVLADGGTILVGGIDRRLYAVDAASGQEEWSFKADNWFWGRPLVVEDSVYAPNLDGRVYALDMKSGEPVWDEPFQTEPESPIRSSPALAGDVLVVVDRRGDVYGLDPEEGTLKWSGPALLNETVLADPLVLDGMVLISAQGGNLFRIDPATGSSLVGATP